MQGQGREVMGVTTQARRAADSSLPTLDPDVLRGAGSPVNSHSLGTSRTARGWAACHPSSQCSAPEEGRSHTLARCRLASPYLAGQPAALLLKMFVPGLPAALDCWLPVRAPVTC